MANMRQTNKMDAQCDRLVTERSWQCFVLKVTSLQLRRLHLAPPLGVTLFEFCRDFQQQKTRVPGLSCGVVCVILRLAISVEHWLVMDGQTDTQRQLILVLASIMWIKTVFRLTCFETKPFYTFNPVSVTRGHACKLCKPQYECTVYRNFFVERLVNVWNSLPNSVDFSSLSKFQKSVKQVDFSHLYLYGYGYLWHKFWGMRICHKLVMWLIIVCLKDVVCILGS